MLGLHSPLLDAVRALRTKAGRRERQAFAIEGPTMLAEALRSGVRPESVYATRTALDASSAIVDRLDAGVPLYVVPERGMSRLSELETAPGLLAVVPMQDFRLEAVLAGGGPVLLLAGVGDPGNAGTLLRSAEIFGFSGVLFGGEAVEPYNPKVVRASMGAIFRLPVVEASAEAIAAAAAQAGYELVATGEGGEPLSEFRFRRRSIVGVGNERRGVRGWLPAWDRTVTIPQRGPGESLNAAVAGSIVAYVVSSQLERAAESS